MKKVIISLLALLLLAAQAQAQKQPLAVLVVGVDSWMFGDVIAHIVGEELKRGNPDLVPVTREKFVQNKLKALRRATGWINYCELRDWANEQGLSQVCLVEAKAGGSNTAFSFTHAQQKYSAQLIDATSNTNSCVANFTFNRGGGGEMAPAELTKVAWEVVGRLQSNSCKTPHHIKCYMFEPEMVFVEGGSYMMGGTSPVTLSDFRIGKYEVTQGEWLAVMGSFPETTPSDNFRGDDLPMIYMSYNDITGPNGFLAQLNAKAGITDASKKYRLPTEAEWVYAARGGASSKGYTYSGSNTLWHVGWYSSNSGSHPHAVGARKTQTADGTFAPVDGANELGLYDMSGNVGEICQDWYAAALPSGTNPIGPPDGSLRVIRGGTMNDGEVYCRSDVATRFGVNADSRLASYGFRVVLP